MKALQVIREEIEHTHKSIDGWLEDLNPDTHPNDFKAISASIHELRQYAKGLYFAEATIMDTLDFAENSIE